MKPIRSLAIISIVSLLALTAFASDKGKKVKLKGTLVDIACMVNDKEDPQYMREKHTKGCFQMPACEKSGYALLTKDDKVLRFDANGNEIAKQMIASADRDKDWRIKVQGRLTGEQLQVAKLELQK